MLLNFLNALKVYYGSAVAETKFKDIQETIREKPKKHRNGQILTDRITYTVILASSDLNDCYRLK